MGKSNTALFGAFNGVSAKAWKQKIQVDLKGADYNGTLVWESAEGIKVKPFYHADDPLEGHCGCPFVTHTPQMAQHIYAGRADMANKNAKKALQRGAEALHFLVPKEEVSFAELLAGIDLETTRVHLQLPFLSAAHIKSALRVASTHTSSLYFHLDPVGHLARTGTPFIDLKKDMDEVHGLLGSGAAHLLSVDVSLYENAGAHKAQQLGYAMAHANEYLNQLNEKGSLGQLESLSFKVSVGGNYFFEMAKLRALRLLWASLTQAYGISVPCHILAYPTKRNKTVYGYNVNMLRTTTECMSALLGGADTVMNTPYDALYHKSNEFGERIALNQLLLLREEAHFGKVSNAADGAYYVERLTEQLAQQGLELLKMVERGGGFLKQLKDGTLQKKIRESAQKEQRAFDAGEHVLVGTNHYQSGEDRMKDELQLYPFAKTKARKTTIEPILEKRLAEALEQKRLEDEQKKP
ncbi:methylmalonyl-CoA mutase subunit beta [Maribacter sp. 2307ULW6-5]|uniref:methylmalonyl-CoA mutase subunit beta n=1 Tax=Maribacter sp. 2307ULW6-5 TaxID=3386275 RepID=UPI0039BC926F